MTMAFITAHEADVAATVLELALNTDRVDPKDRLNVQQVADALYALTNDSDMIVLKEEPDERICSRCGDNTDTDKSPDGTRCPDCYDRETSDVTSPDYKGDLTEVAALVNHAEELTGIKSEPQPEVVKMLVLSTSHITDRVSKDFVTLVPYGANYKDVGHIMPIVSDDPRAFAEMPVCVGDAVKFAQAHGCTYLMFDKDAETVDGLPVYDW